MSEPDVSPNPNVRQPRLRGLAKKIGDLPLQSKVLLAHGLFDALFPNPLTAPPLFRVLERQHRSKKKRGWAWLFLMCGLMKVRSALADEPTAACLGGWAYGLQAVSIAMEGFYHHSIARPTKVLGSTVCFSVAMWLWLQVTAWRHARLQLEDTSPYSDGSPEAGN
ncbi:unnamed protein product [Polarella glacialis]|uniref:Uncharacterized protein n=1 Tax=Polarella glacialis TaxID=89957 RepID=A0A813I7C4_POLGL|nr:unnamed protein product [Polarella glacialis]|mmetsp:Transcript_10677/g.16979  ORF Transcript_10677/g.16979 Transcript_10677/m.16979 type:complete len:165 (+) Transcript_10677:93-587(+)